MAFFEFPHTRTYDSDLAWLIKAYKILTGKVNNIEQTIEDTINEALQGEELKQLITQMIAEALPLNVKYPPAESGLAPAVGDGETDDTAALQTMIAYANTNNMPMIFPAGVYRVTGLNVNVDTVFQGFDATLMLAPVSAAPLINLTADLATSGLTLNGNLGGQTTAQNVINIVNGSFTITNTTIMGGESCIEGTLVGDSIIGDSYLCNFQEYGIHAEGTGSFAASNVNVTSVASGGAMRFMRIDCDNCTISNFSSQASIPIGFEITGDNNAISANIPKAETPVNDGGNGNTWTIIGKDEKLYFEGSATHEYQNYQETVIGDYTQNVGDFNGTASGSYSFSGEDIVLDPSNPLTYKTPLVEKFFNRITFKDPSNKAYDVLVEKDCSFWNHLFVASEWGLDNTGTDDCTSTLQTLLSEMEENDALIFDYGSYLINGAVDIDKTVIFYGGVVTGSSNVHFKKDVIAPRYQIFNTVVSLSPQRIYPEWFGCSTDGKDGTAGINNAISSISEGGIISFLPVYSGSGGQYLINGTIVVETSGIELEGNGACISSNAITLFDCTPTKYTEEVKIHDFKIVCTNSNNNSTCFSINNCTRFWFNNIIMVGWLKGAVLSKTVNAIFNNVFYIMQTASDCIAFELGETNASARFIECYCAFDFGSANQGTGWLITGHDFRDLMLVRCETAAGSNGINFGTHSNSDPVYAWDVFITNCVFDNFKGRAILANYMKTAINIQIDNCWFTPGTSNGYCVELNSVDNIAVTGCEFMSVQTGGSCGIIANASSNLMISNNTFLNCNPAINIASGCVGVTIANNSIATSPDSPTAGEMSLTSAIFINGNGILAIGNSIYNAGGTPSYSNGIDVASGTTNSTAAFNFINSGTSVTNNAGSGCAVIGRGEIEFS